MNFRKAKRKASQVAGNREKLIQLVQAVALKLKNTESREDLVSKVREKINTLVRMVRAYIKGDYREIPWKSLTLITAGLIYFINPFDVIPDFIPFTGFVDDIALVMWIFNTLDKDIEAFREWEEETNTGNA